MRIHFLNWQKKIPNEDGVIKAFELAPEADCYRHLSETGK